MLKTGAARLATQSISNLGFTAASTSAGAACLCRRIPTAQNVRRQPGAKQPNATISQRIHAGSTRSYASAAANAVRGPAGRSGVKVGTLFLALSILGIGATGVGLYGYYTSLKTFPPEIRTDIRSALRCKSRQDYVSSDKFFEKVWERITTDPALQDRLGLLKVTGVAIAWSEMLEEASRRADHGGMSDPASDAYGALFQAYEWTRSYLKEKTGNVEERMRGVSLAVKLGNMAEGQDALEKAAEEQLTWAVEEVLRLATQGTPKDTSKPRSKDSEEDAILIGELGLPSWVSKTDMGGTLETLGNLYARKGNVEYAMPLYMQSISLLLPPPNARKSEPPTADKCHAATIMNNLSSLIASAPKAPSAEIGQSTQAFAWASKASEIATLAIANAKSGTAQQEAEQCKPTATVALYNLGMLKLMEGDKKAAKVFLDEAKERASEWGFKDAQVRASEVLKAL